MSKQIIYDFYYQLLLSFYFNDTLLYNTIFINYIFSSTLYNSYSFFSKDFITYSNFPKHQLLIDNNKEEYIVAIGLLVLENINNKYFEEKTVINKFIQKNRKYVINDNNIDNIKNIIYNYLEEFEKIDNATNNSFNYNMSPIIIDNKIIKYAESYISNIHLSHEILYYTQKKLHLSSNEYYMCKFWDFTSINYSMIWILFMVSIFNNNNNNYNIDFIIHSLFLLSLSQYIVTIFIYNVNLNKININKILDISLYSSINSLIFEYLFGNDINDRLIVDKKYLVMINPYIKNINSDKINFSNIDIKIDDKNLLYQYNTWNEININISNIGFLKYNYLNSSNQINIIIGKLIYNMIIDKVKII